ncbi:MAG TPA: YafY family protein [Actinomycetes bacterium]|jgi:predicted DNA-binding transcriptional regulator YafY
MDTSERLLKLLSLLQTRSDWTGSELAERLQVSGRTVRNDVERLRRLGYPVHASPGVGGGYRLGAGAALPPLLLDDEEAVAVAVGLRTAAGGAVAGIEETSLRALVKLEQVLPSRLRHRVNALHSAMAAVQTGGPTVDAEVLTAIAAAIRDRQRLRFDYRHHDGSASVRDVEPHRMVSWGRRWYLVAYDADRRDWRTFRVDRLRPRTPAGPRFTPRRVPGGDVTAYVERSVGQATWGYRARVLLHAPASSLAGRLPPAVELEPVDDRTCIATAGADDPAVLALYLGLLDVDFDILDAPELAEALARLAARYARASRSRPSRISSRPNWYSSP